MTQNKPLALLTNDDGIESSFLLALVEAFSSSFEVVTCAPDGERSWIGHAISRNAKLLPRKIDDYPSLAYALNGTPADCVNLACGNLLPKAPDLVVSGINILGGRDDPAFIKKRMGDVSTGLKQVADSVPIHLELASMASDAQILISTQATTSSTSTPRRRTRAQAA